MRLQSLIPLSVVPVILLVAGMAAPVGAQETQPTGTWNGDGVTLGGEGFRRPQKKRDFTVSTVPAARGAGQAWPRLDAGAVLCRSEDDLQRRMALEAGDTTEGALPQCQRIRDSTPIAIVARHGLGRTEVRIAAGPTGWTNAWLPDKSPVPK